MEIKIRKATKEDSQFISETILQSESTNYEAITFSKMFEFDKPTMLSTFSKIVDNETNGHPLTFKTYFIAELDGNRCGALSAYIEGENGDSNLQMANCMMSVIDRKTVMKGFMFSKKNSETIIPKSKGSLQIDCVATRAEFRGKGVFKALFQYACEDFTNLCPKSIEVQVWKNNPAIEVYKKVGFSIKEEYPSQTSIGMAKILLAKVYK